MCLTGFGSLLASPEGRGRGGNGREKLIEAVVCFPEPSILAPHSRVPLPQRSPGSGLMARTLSKNRQGFRSGFEALSRSSVPSAVFLVQWLPLNTSH